MFERLPSPFGLVRYGVAPDNQTIKSVARVLGAPFDAHPATAPFLGNVSFGRDISRHELRRFSDAVICAFGAEHGRMLDIPGNLLPGSFAANEFVGWYSGHPDAAERSFPLHGRGVAVVGPGNVVLDVARVLARSAEEIAATDVPDWVVVALRCSRITDIYLLCRRGPAQMKFTPVELRGLGERSNPDLIIDPTELALSESERAELGGRPQLERMVSMLRPCSAGRVRDQMGKALSHWCDRHQSGRRGRQEPARRLARPGAAETRGRPDGHRTARASRSQGRGLGGMATVGLPRSSGGSAPRKSTGQGPGSGRHARSHPTGGTRGVDGRRARLPEPGRANQWMTPHVIGRIGWYVRDSADGGTLRRTSQPKSVTFSVKELKT